MAPVGTRILTVEDDERIRTAVKMALEDEGWQVEEAESGEEALESFARHPSDVVLIDIMLPGVDGFEVCRSIRRSSDVPIVMVTARADTHDVVAGLEAGADDYLAKPFEPKELLLRINAILRRTPVKVEPKLPKVITLGEVRYDVDRGEMWRGHDLVRLTATEAALMRIFAARPGEPVTRTQLVEDLNRGSGRGDNGQTQERAVDVQITRLRRKFETDPRQPRYLQTVRGAGYMLAPD